MSKSYKNVLAIAEHLAISPATVLDHSMSMVEAAVNGEIDIVDPTSPYMNLMECSATQTAGAILKSDTLSRKQYWKLAQTMEDLYPHMSDGDFAGIYASPVEDHVIKFGLDMEQLKKYAKVDTTTSLHKVIIPRDTVFSAQDIHFTCHFPVDIFIYDNGQVRAFFDLSEKSPIRERKSNVIKTRTIHFQGREIFEMWLPADQLNVTSLSSPVADSARWTLEIPFTDNFYHARAYFTSDNQTWTEMHVTHDADNYDPINPTMVLKVSGSTLVAHIPNIYISEGKVGSSARVDVYTTKGKMSIDLGTTEVADWSVIWNDFSGLSKGYVSPLQDITGRIIYSDAKSNGGLPAKTFNQVRNSVIYNLYGKSGAYTDLELKAELKDKGYTVSKRKDVLTERIYVAARSLSDAASTKAAGVTSGIGIVNERIQFYTGRDDLEDTMKKNTNRVTIRPTALYKEVGDGIVLLSDSDVTSLSSKDIGVIAETLNAERYYYSPFHYVIDYSEPVLETRGYQLNRPKESFRNFVDSNKAVGFIVTTTDVQVELSGTEYIVTVTAETPKGTNNLHLQMSYSVNGTGRVEKTEAASIVSDTESRFVFRLPGNLDVDRDGTIDFTFNNGTQEPTAVRAKLEQEFDFVYVIETASVGTSRFDSKFIRGAITNSVTPVSHEECTIEFGKHLEGLFLKSRTVLKPPVYKKHVDDVPDLYTENVYYNDAQGKVIEVAEDGSISFKIEHAMGTQKKNPDGSLKYIARAGDDVVDSRGFKIEEKPSDFIREVRVPLFDARYRFATDSKIATYRDGLAEQLIDYLERDVVSLRSSILERTELFFEPESTAQATNIRISEGREMVARTALNFTIEYQVTTVGYDDETFRQSIEAKTKEIIAEELSSKTFSVSGLSARLDKLGGEAVLNVSVKSSLPGNAVAEITDGISAFSIGNVMRAETNGTLTVVDDVNFSFVK